MCFLLFFCCRPHTRPPSKREKNLPLVVNFLLLWYFEMIETKGESAAFPGFRAPRLTRILARFEYSMHVQAEWTVLICPERPPGATKLYNAVMRNKNGTWRPRSWVQRCTEPEECHERKSLTLAMCLRNSRSAGLELRIPKKVDWLPSTQGRRNRQAGAKKA